METINSQSDNMAGQKLCEKLVSLEERLKKAAKEFEEQLSLKRKEKEQIVKEHNIVVRAANEMLSVLKFHNIMNEDDILKLVKNEMGMERWIDIESEHKNDFFKIWTRDMDRKDCTSIDNSKMEQENNEKEKESEKESEKEMISSKDNDIWQYELYEARMRSMIRKRALVIENCMSSRINSVKHSIEALNANLDQFVEFVANDEHIPSFTQSDLNNLNDLNGVNDVKTKYLQLYKEFVSNLTELKDSNWQTYEDCIKFKVKVLQHTKVKQTNVRQKVVIANIDKILSFPRRFTHGLRVKLFGFLDDDYVASLNDVELESKILQCKLDLLKESLNREFYSVTTRHEDRLRGHYERDVKNLFGMKNEERLYFYFNQFDMRVDYSVYPKVLLPPWGSLTRKQKYEFITFTTFIGNEIINKPKEKRKKDKENKDVSNVSNVSNVFDGITGIALTPPAPPPTFAGYLSPSPPLLSSPSPPNMHLPEPVTKSERLKQTVRVSHANNHHYSLTPNICRTNI